MADCTTCGHEVERHLFGGMCFYCDCKRATLDISKPVYLLTREAETKRRASRNGTTKKPSETAPRLGNK